MGDGNGNTLVLPNMDFDKGSGHDYHPAIGLYLPKDGGHALVDSENPLPVADAQGSDFFPSINGRLFVGTQDPGVFVTGTTGVYNETTPQAMMRNVAASKRIVLRNITVSVASVGGGGASIEVNIVIDTADRLSAGGTPITPHNLNTGSAATSALTGLLSSPTATASGGGTREIVSIVIPKTIGTNIVLDQQSGVILDYTSTLLLYLRNAAGVASTFTYNMLWEEID